MLFFTVLLHCLLGTKRMEANKDLSRLVKAVHVLSERQVTHVAETARFRIGSTLHSCQYVRYWFNKLVIVNTHSILEIGNIIYKQIVLSFSEKRGRK